MTHHAIGIFNANWKHQWKAEREYIAEQYQRRKQEQEREFWLMLEALQTLDPNWESWWDNTPAPSNLAMVPLMRKRIDQIVFVPCNLI